MMRWLIGFLFVALVLVGCSQSGGSSFIGSDWQPGERPYVWNAGEIVKYKLKIKNDHLDYRIAGGSITCLTEGGQLTIEVGNVVLAPGETREIGGSIDGKYKIVAGSENVCIGFFAVPKGLAETKGQMHSVDSKFLSRTVKAEVVTSVSCDLEMSYDPVEALTFGYKLTLNNKSMKPVTCDLGIYMDGKLIKEHTIGAESFKSAFREGIIKESKRSIHQFEAKILKIHNI